MVSLNGLTPLSDAVVLLEHLDHDLLERRARVRLRGGLRLHQLVHVVQGPRHGRAQRRAPAGALLEAS